MSNILYADPDAEVSAMCHKNHVDRAFLYDQPETVTDAHWEPVQEEAKSGPVIHIYEKNSTMKEPESSELMTPSIGMARRILGALARGGAGMMFLCGVADGLIDTTYGLMLTIICIGWGLLHLLQGVAHG